MIALAIIVGAILTAILARWAWAAAWRHLLRLVDAKIAEWGL
ncbi:hypothetical protein [Croceibacterium aestuarii]|nr:hypothetical protein [Croceibacterium sp. D39]